MNASMTSQRLSATCSPLPRATRPARKASVVVRADVKQGREYREDSGKLSEPVAPAPDKNTAPPGMLYADEVSKQRSAGPKPASNLSPEMKARLKKEYVGLGGTPDKGMPGIPRRTMVFASTVVEERVSSSAAAPTASSSSSSGGERNGQASTSSAASTSSPSAPAPASAVVSSKWAISPDELLTSTLEHRLWTFGSMAIMAAVLQHAVAQVEGPGDALTLTAAVAAAYVLSDLGTGIYHWSVDNYGDGTTPLVGRQIAAFQGHHQRPWTITKREFCNNVHQVFKPATVPSSLLLGISFFAPCGWNGFASTFLFLVCMSQQFHAWSHMKKSQLPAPIIALQDAGLLISRKAHGAHHRSPFECNYCIVSGLWNDALDGSGVLQAAEKAIAAATGVEPRCWHAPEYEFEELEVGVLDT